LVSGGKKGYEEERKRRGSEGGKRTDEGKKRAEKAARRFCSLGTTIQVFSSPM